MPCGSLNFILEVFIRLIEKVKIFFLEENTYLWAYEIEMLRTLTKWHLGSISLCSDDVVLEPLKSRFSTSEPCNFTSFQKLWGESLWHLQHLGSAKMYTTQFQFCKCLLEKSRRKGAGLVLAFEEVKSNFAHNFCYKEHRFEDPIFDYCHWSLDWDDLSDQQ